MTDKGKLCHRTMLLVIINKQAEFDNTAKNNAIIQYYRAMEIKKA